MGLRWADGGGLRNERLTCERRSEKPWPRRSVRRKALPGWRVFQLLIFPLNPLNVNFRRPSAPPCSRAVKWLFKGDCFSFFSTLKKHDPALARFARSRP